jgi:hypothetical protein
MILTLFNDAVSTGVVVQRRKGRDDDDDISNTYRFQN